MDGIDVRDVTLESLRGNIGIVLQDTILFSGTIRDNIAYGKPDATARRWLIAAAKAAQAHDFITQFPDGYDTVRRRARRGPERRPETAHRHCARAAAQPEHPDPG